jgi:hypothetical protein
VVAGFVGWPVGRSGSSAVAGRGVAAGRVVAIGVTGLPSSSAVVGVTGWALARGAAWRVVAADVWRVVAAGAVGRSSGPVSLVGPVGAVEGDGGAVDVQGPAVVVEAAVMA